jgi:hypothetical protein
MNISYLLLPFQVMFLAGVFAYLVKLARRTLFLKSQYMRMQIAKELNEESIKENIA